MSRRGTGVSGPSAESLFQFTPRLGARLSLVDPFTAST